MIITTDAPWLIVRKDVDGNAFVIKLFDDEHLARTEYATTLGHAREHGGNIELRQREAGSKKTRVVHAYEGRAAND